jgi:hypothetical protein
MLKLEEFCVNHIWQNQEKKTMKLNMLFILMDLLTVLAYPVVFMHGKLHKFSKLEDGISLVNFLLHIPAEAGR